MGTEPESTASASVEAAAVVAAELNRTAGFHTGKEWAERVLKALSRAGYAVVQLPEPSYVDEPEEGMKGVGFNGGPGDVHLSERGVYAHDGLVYDQWDGVTPSDARLIGSWWLAAAAAALPLPVSQEEPNP